MYIFALLALLTISMVLLSEREDLRRKAKINREAIDYLHKRNQELERELNRSAMKEWTE